MLGKRCRQDVYRGRDVPKPSSFGARRSFFTLLAFNDDGYTPKAERSAGGLDMGMKNGAKLSGERKYPTRQIACHEAGVVALG